MSACCSCRALQAQEVLYRKHSASCARWGEKLSDKSERDEKECDGSVRESCCCCRHCHCRFVFFFSSCLYGAPVSVSSLPVSSLSSPFRPTGSGAAAGRLTDLQVPLISCLQWDQNNRRRLSACVNTFDFLPACAWVTSLIKRGRKWAPINNLYRSLLSAFSPSSPLPELACGRQAASGHGQPTETSALAQKCIAVFLQNGRVIEEESILRWTQLHFGNKAEHFQKAYPQHWASLLIRFGEV